MIDFLQDLKHGLSMPGRMPGLTAAARLTLALGIGANMAIFKVLDVDPLLGRTFADGESSRGAGTSSAWCQARECF